MSNAKRWREFLQWWQPIREYGWHTNPNPDECIICRVNKKIDEIKKPKCPMKSG